MDWVSPYGGCYACWLQPLGLSVIEMYAWVPWFHELAKSIADGTPGQLAERARRVEWRRDGSESPLLKYEPHNVDPFSFIYTISANCGALESRTRVIGSVSTVFELKAKLRIDLDDAFYFPQGLPQNTLFHDGKGGDPELLWELLRDALQGIDSLRAEKFDRALEIKGVGIAKLTQALFLINAHEFAPYDKSTRSRVGSASSASPDWSLYRRAIDEMRAAFPGCELYEINLFAYLTRSKQIRVGPNTFQVSSNVFGDNVDRWDDFDRQSSVFTGGQAPGTEFGRDDGPFSNAYPLDAPDRGDVMLARCGGKGRGIGIVWNNDYRTQLAAESRVHVIWLNKAREGLGGGIALQRGFTRADKIADAFRSCRAYEPTFAMLDGLRVVDGLTREAVLSALADFDQLGREEFLGRYGQRPSRSRWIQHDGRQYDMKPVWRAAFGHMDATGALARDDPKYFLSSDLVQKHLEALGFEIGGDINVDQDAPDGQQLNRILYGPPGTGKTWHTVNLALEIVDGHQEGRHDRERFDALAFDPVRGTGNIAMVTFHQNFAYEDFVEGIRPVLASDVGGLRYELHQGLFKLIADAAGRRPGERFVLIIDEINRGNIARIFGELITLIEDSRRLGRSEATHVTLPYSKELFGVPGNLHLLGTMNTADRSIQLLDTALRRRFAFVEMMPDPDHPRMAQIDGVDCGRMLRTINDRIACLLDREHQVGHTYLLDIGDMAKLARSFRTQIFPLLQEYFFDDWSKIKAVLGASPFVMVRQPGTGILDQAFMDEDRRLFGRLPDNDPQWESPDAYRAIYAAEPDPAEGD